MPPESPIHMPRNTQLPEQHRSADSKDIVRLGMGLVGTIAALVLGLLIASAKSAYDTQSNELTQLCADVGLLDRILAHYGPEAKETRDQLRSVAIRFYDGMWPKDSSASSGLEPSASSEALYDSIQRLSPKTDEQRAIQAAALNRATSLGQERWLMYARSGNSVPVAVLGVLILWLTILFVSFGLFAPRNATVLASLFVSALSVSCAILVIVNLYQPFEGLIQIPSAPLRELLARIGQ
jgi:hypothetical protein